MEPYPQDTILEKIVNHFQCFGNPCSGRGRGYGRISHHLLLEKGGKTIPRPAQGPPLYTG